MIETSAQLGKTTPVVAQINQKTQYEGIDIVKAFFAICVVSLHCLNSHLEWSDYWFFSEHMIFRMSVPFFFIASGFFLGKNIRRTPEKHKEICLKRGKTLFMYYLLWGTINSTVSMFMDIKNGTSFFDAFLQLIHKMLVTTPPIMWYLGSLFTATYLLSLVRTRKSHIITMWIGIFLFALGLLMENYSGIFAGTALQGFILGYQNVFISTNNVIFVGYAFVSIGFWLGKYANLDAISPKKTWIILTIGVVLSFLETWALRWWVPVSLMNRNGFLLTSLPVAYGIFLLACNPNIHFRFGTRYPRMLSNFFYFTHSTLFAAILFLTDTSIYTVYIVVMSVLFVFSVIVYKWNNRFINKMYGI